MKLISEQVNCLMVEQVRRQVRQQMWLRMCNGRGSEELLRERQRVWDRVNHPIRKSLWFCVENRVGNQVGLQVDMQLKNKQIRE